MDPSAGHVTGSSGGPAGKKRKAVPVGDGSEKIGGGSGGKRAKKGGDGDGVEKARTKKDSDKRLGDGKTGTAGGENKAAPTKAKSKTAGDGTNVNATGNRKKDGKLAAISKKHRSGEKVATEAKEAAGKSSSPSRKSKTKTGKMLASKAVGGGETGLKSNSGGKKAGEPASRSNGSSQLKSGGGKSSQTEALGNGSSTGRSSSGGSTSSKTKHKNDKKATKKKPRMGLSIKPTVIPPPVVVQREVPEHHVISNRRAVVLARTFAKETEEAQKDFEEAVAAAERSRVAREQRLKASSSPRSLPRPPAYPGASSSTAAKPVGGAGGNVNDATTAAAAVSSGPGRRSVWPDLGFGGQPWGLGPFYREEVTEGGDTSASFGPTMDRELSPSPSCTSFAEGGSSHSRRPGEQGKPGHIDAHGQGCVVELGVTRQSDGSAARSPVGAASAAAATPIKPPRALKEIRRARVDAGEAVDLGEDAAFRNWLGRLRAIQVRVVVVLRALVWHIEEACSDVAMKARGGYRGIDQPAFWLSTSAW